MLKQCPTSFLLARCQNYPQWEDKIIMVLFTEAAFIWMRHFQAKSPSFYFSITISRLFPSYSQVIPKFKLDFFSVVQPSRELQVGFDFSLPNLSQFLCPGRFCLDVTPSSAHQSLGLPPDGIFPDGNKPCCPSLGLQIPPQALF